MLYRKWHSEQLNMEQVSGLQQSLGISSLLAKVLVSKGATSREKAREMFFETLQLSDPYLMKDMDRACDILKEKTTYE